jgi:hypothetical protein
MQDGRELGAPARVVSFAGVLLAKFERTVKAG